VSADPSASFPWDDLTPEGLFLLQECSMSIPTGQRPGFRWRRLDHRAAGAPPGGWFTGEVTSEPLGGGFRIEWRRVRLPFRLPAGSVLMYHPMQRGSHYLIRLPDGTGVAAEAAADAALGALRVAAERP
jgi:hypothetical protein